MRRLAQDEPTVRMTHVTRDGAYYHAACYTMYMRTGPWVYETGRAIDASQELLPAVPCPVCKELVRAPIARKRRVRDTTAALRRVSEALRWVPTGEPTQRTLKRIRGALLWTPML